MGLNIRKGTLKRYEFREYPPLKNSAANAPLPSGAHFTPRQRRQRLISKPSAAKSARKAAFSPVEGPLLPESFWCGGLAKFDRAPRGIPKPAKTMPFVWIRPPERSLTGKR
jgi:hypothetical protein